MPRLFLVATPIGNLEDISLRALRVLAEVKLIAAEDTRKTRKLLTTYKIKAPLTSYHEHGKKTKLPYLLKHLEQEDIALVSESGMPGISDPGYDLVLAAIEKNVQVVAIPGASVLPVALAVSGLPADKFTYVGFLPRRKGERRRLIESVAKEPWTLIAFESPHRLQESLRDLIDVLGDRRIAVCRELTKVYEEVFRGTLSQAIAHFKQPKGEFTLVVAGYSIVKIEGGIDDSILKELKKLRSQGLSAKEAVTKLAGTAHLSKKALYRAWIDLL
ncbi:MAG: 16S rRNA (cytidine(1402)-2'-O)-methyltransferase [Chloroflexi bacterium]|nr:16S rRNA (cytidine(1402)-2'-O)-methyltransferase [Chloroflexota bacterium]